MNNALELFSQLKQQFGSHKVYTTSYDENYNTLKQKEYLYKDVYFEPIEKALKALEIIISKEVNIFWIKLCFGEFKGLEMYNTGGRKTLTREEYALLKEELYYEIP